MKFHLFTLTHKLMRKTLIRTLFITVCLLVGSHAVAQTVPSWEKGSLVRKGGSIVVNGQQLDREATLALLSQAGGAQLADEWGQTASKRGLVIGLTAGGFGVAAVGGALAIAGSFAGSIGDGLGAAMSGSKPDPDAGLKDPHALGGLIAVGVGRTQDSQSCNRSSILLPSTTFQRSVRWSRCFSLTVRKAPDPCGQASGQLQANDFRQHAWD